MEADCSLQSGSHSLIQPVLLTTRRIIQSLEDLLPKDNETMPLPLVGPISRSTRPGCARSDDSCEECLRANPPTRVTCLYCACTLPVTEASKRLRKPTLSRPEKGQPGYNNIFLPQAQKLIADNVLAEAAGLLKLTPEGLQKIVATQRALPLAHTASPAEASLILERLRDLGLETVILGDEELGIKDSSVTRIRSSVFDERSGCAAGGGDGRKPNCMDRAGLAGCWQIDGEES